MPYIFLLHITPCAHMCQPTNHMPASSPLWNHTHCFCSCPTAHIPPFMNINLFPLGFTTHSIFQSERVNSFNDNRKSYFTTWWLLVDQGRKKNPNNLSRRATLQYRSLQTCSSTHSPSNCRSTTITRRCACSRAPLVCIP